MQVRSVLNIYGIFLFLGYIIANIIAQVYFPTGKESYQPQFYLFLVIALPLYYFLVNSYFIGKRWRIFFYALLVLLIIVSLSLIGVQYYTEYIVGKVFN